MKNILFLFIIAFISCKSSDTTKITKQNKGKRVENSDFSFSYPKNWKIIKSFCVNDSKSLKKIYTSTITLAPKQTIKKSLIFLTQKEQDIFFKKLKGKTKSRIDLIIKENEVELSDSKMSISKNTFTDTITLKKYILSKLSDKKYSKKDIIFMEITDSTAIVKKNSKIENYFLHKNNIYTSSFVSPNEYGKYITEYLKIMKSITFK